MKGLLVGMIVLFAFGTIAEKDKVRSRNMMICFAVSVVAMLFVCGYIG